MDNFRIIINNIDKSQSLDIMDSAATNFTIVDAPCGPQKPFYIPAGKFSTIGEVFGYPDSDYKDLQEVYDVNSGYGVWVSAPYNPIGSKVPVAYVTPAGVFARHSPVILAEAEYLEDIEEESLSVEGISLMSVNPEILIPVGKEASLFTDTGVTVSTVLEYDITEKLSINLSFDVAAELQAMTDTLYYFLNPTNPLTNGGRIMSNGGAAFGILTLIIPGKDPIDIAVTYSAGDIFLKTGGVDTGETIGTVDASGAVTSLNITGAVASELTGDYLQYFNQSTLDSIWSNSDFLNSVKVYWKATLARENVTATIYSKYLSDRTINLNFAAQDFGNKIKNTVSESIGALQSSYTFSWSLDSADTDGFNNSLEVSSKIDAQSIVNIHVFKTFDGFNFTKTNSPVGPEEFEIPRVILTGGVRVAVTDTDAFWHLAQEPEFTDVDVFFSLKTPASDSTFFSLSNFHSLSRFVFPKLVTKADAVTSLTKLPYGSSYWAITGLFTRTSTYNKQPFTTSLVGAYVNMVDKAIEKANGGAALMYTNNAAGLGGQLGVSVKKNVNEYKYGDSELKILNEKNYNPITLGPYGTMVTSHKTCAAGEISDWSYIGHVSAFLDFQKEVRKNVMIPQIGKANNDYYRELRYDQVTDMLKKRTEGSDRIWTSASADTSTENVNTPDVLSQRLFKLVVTVKVDIFSEGVELQFISEGQV